mmetsp:Transcript_11735/g.16828  ORF Transcript_11735/g.16828 Transcript_11735/m.16828 type:complete len:595 (+) Transcript_11735:220-2004(+)|eukprot:CAMPEP_0201701118 /NCGR_PEP_ID=MMETSP0578-20130828/31353_1 /ASSEMBLY_ACC=CAM_ASM_000663 /TAXON_ID=267565 /ORGANISM="Skeletonema grethea, Strain CCMP 1804" /LENGTH=594 /DNA_ID=CAMNT_0048188347 /DNA_START=180 /DNA_END=1964 /DNA_ORIENTATION=+
MTDNTLSKESLHLDQPLLSPRQQATEDPNNGGDTTRPNQTNNNFDNGSNFMLGGPRILDRDGTFSQSRGRWRVSNTRKRHVATSVNGVSNDDEPPSFFATSSSRQHPPHVTTNNSLFQRLCNRLACCHTSSQQQYRNPSLTRRCWDDWFHTLSYTPTLILMLGVFAAYFITIVLFAGLYLTVNKVGERYSGGGINQNGMEVDTAEMIGDGVSFCGMDINNHMEALYFSLSTMATIGYGTSDYYFGECWTPFVLVLSQTLTALAFSSLAIGLLFQRMSRGQKRGRTIIFSDIAIIRKVRGRWYWMFRVAELRKQHIIGATIRVFCVRHERCPLSEEAAGGDGDVVQLETAHFVSHPLPLLDGSYSQPPSGGEIAVDNGNNDCSFEQCILMGLPHVVVHRMDPLSPMMPPRPIWYDKSGVPRGPASSPASSSSESLTSGGAGTAESSSSLLATVEEGTAHSTVQDITPSADEITEFLQDRQAEIIIYLEGTCEVTGMALQARHSYRMEDIAFHQTFAPCVFPTSSDSLFAAGKKRWNPFSRSSKEKVDDTARTRTLGDESDDNCALEIDFSQFHDLVPAPYDSHSCPYIPSSSLRR